MNENKLNNNIRNKIEIFEKGKIENIDENKKLINNKIEELKDKNIINKKENKNDDKIDIVKNNIKLINSNLNKIEKNEKKEINKNMSNKIKEEIITTNQNNNNKSFNISKNKIDEWEKILCKNIQKINTINENISIKTEENNIINDNIKKIREKELKEYPSFEKDLDLIIKNYITYNKIKYKKGLNEILAVMTLLKYKINLSLTEILNLSQGLIYKFLTNFYNEENTIFALKSSLSLLIILLRYHSPRIYNILEKNNIFPDMFAINWIITLFSSKLDLNLTYYLWNKLIIENDQLFIYFFLVSFLIVNGEKILSAKEKYLSKIISRLTITNIDEIDFIFNIALDLRKETPYSFRILSNKLEIYNFNSKNLENAYEKYKPNSLIAMPIFPTEIYYICYNDIVKCPDELCKNCHGNAEIKNEINENLNKENILDNNNLNNYICPHCSLKINQKCKYILLDLRILEFEKQKYSFLPQMLMIEQDELKSNFFIEKITERFLKDKGTYHFIFMTSGTNNFDNLEDSFYHLDTQSSTSIERKNSIKKQLKNKESDNLKRLLINLINSNYPYISFCYGGFNYIHELSFKYRINLLNHNKNCNLCKIKNNKNKGNSLLKSLNNLKFWKKNNKIFESENTISRKSSITIIDTISLKDISTMIKENKFLTYSGLLNEINGEKINNDNEIMIILKNNEIELLKYSKISFDLEIIKIINYEDIISVERKNHTIINIKIKQQKSQKIKIDLKYEKDSKNFISSLTERKNALIKNKNNK